MPQSLDGATPRSARFAPLLCLGVIAGSATSVRADDEAAPMIPVGEIGAVLPLGYRPSRPDKNTPGTEVPSAIGFGAGVRMDISVIGLLLPAVLDLGRLRVGDFIGLEVGISGSADLVGHWIIGGQVSYEVTRDVGVGLRAYSLTVFDHLFGSSSNDLYNNFIVGEATLRIRHIVGRVRFPLATSRAGGSGYDSAAFGVSLRSPLRWHIMGHAGWDVGVDYDRLSFQNGLGDGVLHRLTGVLAYSY